MAAVQQLLNILEDTASRIEKAQINFKKCPKTRFTHGYVEARLKIVDEYFETFKTAHGDLVKIVNKEQRKSLDYFTNDEYVVCEDIYLTLHGDLKDCLNLNSNTSVQITPTDSDISAIKLPRIQLPTYSGNYDEWTAYHDIFTTLVHNNTALSDVQKLHYLKSSLSGEAASLLKHVQITHDNYIQAWDALKNRYGNKRLIVNSLLKKLFNQKKMTTQTATQVKCVLDVTLECLNNLKNLNIDIKTWDPVIIFIVVQKLDPESHKYWEEYSYKIGADELPTWEDMKTFLEKKYRTLELITAPTCTNRDRYASRTIQATTTTTTSIKDCIMCKENHRLCHCKIFTKMSPSERGNYVKNNNLCFNCLVMGHSSSRCRVPVSCRICHKRHHTLLHLQTESASLVQSCPSTAQPSTTPQPTLAHTNVAEQEEVHVNTRIASQHTSRQGLALLATAMVTAQSNQGHTIVLRALIDQGSQASFLSEKAAQHLKLARQPARGSVIGVGSTRTSVNQVVQLQVLSRTNSMFNMQVQAYVMTKPLTTQIPSKTITVQTWPHLEGIQLADPSYYTPGQIDLLLGVKEYAQIMQQGLIKGPIGTPCAQASALGWILFGEVYNSQQDDSFLVMHLNMEDMLEAIWEIDTTTKRKYTQEERLCEDSYKQTVKRNEEGRYIVKLPFKTNYPKSPEGNSKEIAKSRFLQLERRFKRDPNLKQEYVKVIKEYITLNHMEEVQPENITTQKCVYLPHHPVIKEEKVTSRTRVVFDASCKGHNNISLNDELLVGPQLQEDLRSLIMRWRTRCVCFVADIQKMYRCILVTEEDADFQRILWREDPEEPIKDYRLLRVTFGTASAPYLAVKTLHQLAEDEGKKCPDAVQRIKNDFYMDDLMSGADTLEEAIELARQIQNILNKGGFPLTKWSSNNDDFMRTIGVDNRAHNVNIDLNIDGKIKALGIYWTLRTDQFQYKFELERNSSYITKRIVLSELQKLFDPLGWLSPSVVQAKILVQQLWKAGVGWDEHLDENLQAEWKAITTDFANVRNITINRWLETRESAKENIELHGFSDASMRAYAAVIYCRVTRPNGTKVAHLVASRTRVAPLKTISLPRLELCGAVLLSNLLRQVASSMRVPASQVFAWTDSAIVISWVAGDPNQWKTFVANRVVEVTDNIPSDKWFHVPSHENPADVASRGMLLSVLKRHDLWWKGPKWLTDDKIIYHKPNNILTDLEAKPLKLNVNLNIKDNIDNDKRFTDQFKEFSTLMELLRTITYCRRFLNFKRINEMCTNITTTEFEKSLFTCIKIVQLEEFGEEIKSIGTNGTVKATSTLKSLNPYLDEVNILRVGGRLRHSHLDEQSKHPIILGTKNNLTPLIIADAHLRTLHGGVQLMLCYLRSKYWIIRAKNTVKTYIHKCIICARHNATARTQVMGDLPKERVTPARPFLHSGVDFAGPFNILMHKGRGAKATKAYISIFVCMSTKAIHLELVSDMTSEAFIGAFKRFISRRGKCSHIWSDQGRNFVGANKELVAAWKDANMHFSGVVARSLADDGTQWHLIPAYSPHMGGLWEAGVRSIKSHLKRILTTHLTYEELMTVLCEIEACLNSRPLCPLDDTDPTQIKPLTPGHFLIGEAPIVVPSPDLSHRKISNLSRWQYTQKLLRDFWSRWQNEYLSRLQQRPKWLKKQREFAVGDIILIKMDNLPPGKWSLGRVMEKHPGADGHTRVYSVKSGDTITRRPVTKLCYLPVDTE